MQLKKLLLVVVGLFFTACQEKLWAQAGDEVTTFVLNSKGCIDPSPEAVVQEDCPPGTPSPWTSCPTGHCTTGSLGSEGCVISPNISFINWDHYTNESVLNPPAVGPYSIGRKAVEVSRKLCSRKAACPCKALPSGSAACVKRVYYEEYLVQYSSSQETCRKNEGSVGGD